MNLKELLKDKVTDDITVDQLIELAGEIEIEDKTEDLAKLKKLLDKANSEASEYKKQLRNTLSEQEKAEADRKQAQEELEANYNALLRKTTIAEHKASFLSLGYDEKLAEVSAVALFDGDITSLFQNLKKHNEGLDRKIRTEVLKDTPRPDNGGAKNKPMTLEVLQSLSSEERFKFASENPQEYKNLYLGGQNDRN